MGRKLILFELNEVPLRVLDSHCLSFPNSNLARLRRASTEYETVTEDAGHLSPWVTWPTLHRGVTNEKHTITHLGQDLDEIGAMYPAVWEILARNGATVGVGGSLHSFPLPTNRENYSFYLPDTFAWGSEAFPEALEAFQAFNLTMVGRSPRNVDTGLGLGHIPKLAQHLGELGFTPGTVWRIGSQVVSERVNRARKVRRRTSQATLAFDAVVRQIELTCPDFATFFTNHVASAMHRFWAASFPGDFRSLEYDSTWVETFDGEITHAMVEADRFTGRLVDYVTARPEYLLVIASSMGQGPNAGYAIANELMIVDFEKFMRALGVPSGQWHRRPAMIPQYVFEIQDEFRSQFLANLQRIDLGNTRKVYLESETGKMVTIKLAAYNLRETDKMVFGNTEIEFGQLGMDIIETDFQQASTGYHIPEGFLLAFDPKNPRGGHVRQQVSTCEIAPSILNALGVAPPSYMRRANLLDT